MKTETGTTEIVYILDRSGSMSGLEKDTIGGFNAMVKKEKKTKKKAYVSTILFSDQAEVLHERIPLNKVPVLTEKEYYVCGCTALLDAVGGAVNHIAKIHSRMDPDEVPAKTIFVITTDGMENASKEYSYEDVHRVISKYQEKYKWEFLFIGANIDAAEEAERVGISRERAVNYVQDSIGCANVYEGITNAVCEAMQAPGPEAMRENLTRRKWDKKLRNDFAKRGRN
ncbi:MAG TPA: hypothetical protein DHV96_12655 [Lachnospiraceae bacterium]|nr:hypothetical protein [Lachnospiraceae bacterium]